MCVARDFTQRRRALLVVIGIPERDCGTEFTGTTGTTDAVDVGLHIARHVVINDVCDAFNVQSSSGDVGGHH